MTGRAKAFRGPLFMADLDVPDRFSVAIRFLLWGFFAFIFALVGWEKFWEGQYVPAAINALLLILDTVIAVKWHSIASWFHWLARVLGRDKVTTLYIVLAVLCALGLGFAIGKLLGRTQNATTITKSAVPDTGRISWNIEDAARGKSYFLGLNRSNKEETRVAGIGLVGRNTSADPITTFKGYVRSDITNEQKPFYFAAEDPTAKDDHFVSKIPTLPEETYGIPGLAEFRISTFEKTTFHSGVDGLPFSTFLRDFAPFTIVLEYDDIIIRRQFTKEEVKAQLDLFEHQTDPKKDPRPRITRKPNATPPAEMAFPFPRAIAPPKDQTSNGSKS